MSYKRCPRCQETKNITEFYRLNGKYKRYKTYCRTCQVEMNRDYQTRHHRERYAADPEYRERVKRSIVDYKRRNAEKVRAQEIIRQDILLGRLKRGPCAVCGKEKAQGHHPDYSKPHEVVWLCSKHHQLMHLGEATLP